MFGIRGGYRAPTTVVMKARGSSHHWGPRNREARARIVLLPPHVVRPYVQRHKTDLSDAKA